MIKYWLLFREKIREGGREGVRKKGKEEERKRRVLGIGLGKNELKPESRGIDISPGLLYSYHVMPRATSRPR